MAKALRTIGMIAGAVALIATGVGAIAAAGSALAATAASVATYATLAAGIANIGAMALTKPPPARGSVTEAIIEVDPPSAYGMGDGYFAGVKRHHAGYGPTIKGVPNPYLWEVHALSIGGPIEGPMIPQFDFGAVSSWYNDFFGYDTRLGAIPDTALVAPFGTPTGWSNDHKLSGTACIGWNHVFDRKGKRYASGLPTRGVLSKWVRVYDPRQDSTFPGGSGPCRLGDESTYVWAGLPGDTIPAGENPALHAGTYAFGRYQNGKRVFGMGLPKEAIDFAAIAAWANDCSANNWRIFGFVFESAGITPGQRWQNLRDISIAGGGEPLPLYTGIGFHWDRPRVVLDTVTSDDVAGEIDATGMQSFRDRINTIVPEFVSPAHNWSRIKAEPIVGSTYLTEDGAPNTATFPFNFVKDAAQAGQLAAYRLANGRELYPVSIPLMPRLRAYRPGDCLQLEIPEAGLSTPAVMVQRNVDPATGAVRAVFIGETVAKHPYALGETAIPPPTPALGQSSQERDELAAAVAGIDTAERTLINTSSQGMVNLTATDVAITIGNHNRIYNDKTVAVTGETLTEDDAAAALAASTLYYLYYDDENREGGAVSWMATTDFFTAQNSDANPARHFGGYIRTDTAGGTGTSGGGSLPPGSGGGDPYFQEP